MNERLSGSDWMDYAGAAVHTSIKKNTLYGMVAQKRIPHVRLGGRLVRFRKSALDEWMAQREVTTEDLDNTEGTVG